jgi:hypothetical protein
MVKDFVPCDLPRGKDGSVEEYFAKTAWGTVGCALVSVHIKEYTSTLTNTVARK